MNVKTLTLTLAGAVVTAVGIGCSGGSSRGGGGGTTAPPVTNQGVVTGALPSVQRAATYQFNEYQLNNVVGAGRVTVVGAAPVGTDSLVVTAPLNEILLFNDNGIRAEDSFFTPPSSIAAYDTATFVALSDWSAAGAGDIFVRQGTRYALHTDMQTSEAYVAQIDSDVYALFGGQGEAGQVCQLDPVSFAFQNIADLGSSIPTSAARKDGVLYVGATSNRVGGGAAQLFRVLNGAVEEVQIPGAGGARQQVTAMISVAPAGSGSTGTGGSGSTGTTGSGSTGSTGSGNATVVNGDILLLAVSTYDGNGNPLSGFVAATNGIDWETVISLPTAAPTALAFIDNTVYVGSSDGSVVYRAADGSWVDEPGLPANDGVFSMIARDHQNLLIGTRGPNGALLIQRISDASAPQPGRVLYADVKNQVFANRCDSCHLNTAIVGTSMLLSGSDDAADHAIVEALVDTGNPVASTLLIKATGGLTHGGGSPIAVGDADYQLIQAWINDGALLTAPTAPGPIGPGPGGPKLGYIQDVKPLVMMAGCGNAGCHNAGGGRQLQFSAGYSDDNADRQAVLAHVTVATPNQSAFLTRPSGTSHPVSPWPNGSAQQNTVIQWINDGTLLNGQ